MNSLVLFIDILQFKNLYRTGHVNAHCLRGKQMLFLLQQPSVLITHYQEKQDLLTNSSYKMTEKEELLI